MDLVKSSNLVMKHDCITARLNDQRLGILILYVFDLVHITKAANTDEAVNRVLLRETRSLELLYSTHLEFILHLFEVSQKFELFY